ncbi:unnamed protein product, partial [Ectocarpus fasciculatus]
LDSLLSDVLYLLGGTLYYLKASSVPAGGKEKTRRSCYTQYECQGGARERGQNRTSIEGQGEKQQQQQQQERYFFG